jgi:type IV pilus assembly protein PilB
MGLKEKIVEALLQSKRISSQQLDEALALQKSQNVSLSKILIDKGLITQKELIGMLSNELQIPTIDISRYKIDHDLFALVPERLIKHYQILPISKIGTQLTVAMADPLDIAMFDDLKLVTHCEINPVLCTKQEIQAVIDKFYSSSVYEKMQELVKDLGKAEEVEIIGEEKIDISKVTEESQKQPIVKIVDLVIQEAVKRRASDIHIEPQERALRIRYRIDGVLQEAYSLPKKNQNAIIARLKIMSGLDITEQRLPQDGRFRVKLREKEIDFRVSELPTTFGGKIVLRALDKASLSIGLDKLGFLPGPLMTFKKAIAHPYGMLLITGPTGSGKSTTLYSILNQINTPERNIITVEDPVEYQVAGITQIQIKQDIGLTFAAALRSLLRQSPDVIMIGEIRDFETADIAVKASLTGQLVLSTLHTNDAASSITRLIDMGVEPFLVASSLVMAGAQRLCRKICSYCKQEIQIPQEVLARLNIRASKENKFFKGKGCSRCNSTGYLGRIAILEALLIDEPIKKMILEKASSHDIKKYAATQGMQTLQDNALELFTTGVTTLEEVLRVTKGD